MTGGVVWIYYHWIVIALLLATLASLVANLFVFRSLRPVVLSGTQPLVSTSRPARNEERCIAACVRSLAAQDYPNFELLVLDDHSEDGTAASCANLASTKRIPNCASFPARRCRRGGRARHGPAGNSQRRRKATTCFSPTPIPNTLPERSPQRYTRTQDKRDLLSAWPRLLTITWSEKLVIPMLHVLGGACYPHALVALSNRPALAKALPRAALRALGVANGQFLFFKKLAQKNRRSRCGARSSGRGRGARARDCDAHGRRNAIRELRRFAACDVPDVFFIRGRVGGIHERCAARIRELAGSFPVGRTDSILLFLLPFVWIFVPDRLAVCGL